MKRHSWIVGVLGFLCVVYFVVAWQAQDKFGTVESIVGGLGLVLMGFYTWLDRSRIGETAESRAFRYGSGAVVLVALALGLAVAANILANRYDQRWDATFSKQHTLSQQTVDLVKALDQKVQIVAFFASDSPEESSFKDLVDGYRVHSTLLEVEFHDPLREPFLAQQFQITNEMGTVVLQVGESKQRLESTFDEEALTNALIRVTAAKEHLICFTTEHGEASTDEDYDPAGFATAVLKLEGQNYKVEKLSILKEGSVPSRCEVVVVAGYQVGFLPVEREALARYLVQGGRAFLMMEPTLEPLSVDAFAADLSRYGLELRNDLLLEDNPEARSIGLDPSFVILGPEQFDFHPITSKIKGGVLLQTARSVARAADVPPGLNVQEVVRSSGSAWAETVLDGSQPAKPDEGADKVGSVPLMAVVEITDPKAVPVHEASMGTQPKLPVELGTGDGSSNVDAGDPAVKDDPDLAAEGLGTPKADTDPDKKASNGKLVVVGDMSFASNQLFLQAMNQDLFLNTIAWLVDETDQVSIRANKAAEGTLQMSVAQGFVVWFLAFLGVPGLAVAGAIATWVRRRRM